MKSIFLKIGLLIATVALLVAYKTQDNDKKNKMLLTIIAQSLQEVHFEPKELNDDFSQKMFKMYIERLDYGKRFLLAEDITRMKVFEKQIDDQIRISSYEFFDLSEDIITQRITDAEKFYEEILTTPFDFTQDETIETDPDKIDFVSTKEQLKERWRQYLKYETLSRLQTELKVQQDRISRNDTTVKIKTFAEAEIEARTKVLEAQRDWFSRLKKQEDDDWRWRYINTMTNIFDPHTEFMPPKDKANFDIAMSGKLEGIGATLTEQDGYVKVAEIVPGSPSWKEGSLKAGDLILKVAQGSQDPVDVVNMRLDDAVLLIRGKKGTEVRLTVKKIDGTIKEIIIIRDVVELEEMYAKSAVVQDETKKIKAGYIYLPKFYVDFDNRKGRHCSEDVMLEIEKLKKENIEGLIIDLRNNGGGSLPDVVDMAGLFIDKGPVVQVKSRIGELEVLQDQDPRIQYDGSLVILVNSLSASASEILAAAMQDYKRAVIVGTPSYGKGTVQRIVDFDRMIRGNEDIKPLGSIKITMQKFYRVNGGTTQLQGVTPDIILPDFYSHIEIGEKEMEYALKWDEIAKANYNTAQISTDELSKLNKKSKKRVENIPDFSLINENALRLKRMQDRTQYSLNFEKYKAEREAEENEAKKFADIMKNNTGIAADITKESRETMLTDTVSVARIDKWIDDIKKDVYIEEAVEILKDMKK